MASSKLSDSIQATLSALFEEQRLIAEAISNLQAVLSSVGTSKGSKVGKGGKRRGRPPGSKNATTKAARQKIKTARGRRKWTQAQKDAASARMKKSWAKKSAE